MTSGMKVSVANHNQMFIESDDTGYFLAQCRGTATL